MIRTIQSEEAMERSIEARLAPRAQTAQPVQAAQPAAVAASPAPVQTQAQQAVETLREVIPASQQVGREWAEALGAPASISAGMVAQVANLNATPTSGVVGQVGSAIGVQATPSDSFPLFNQRDVANDPNACGPTGLAMILAAEGLMPPTIEAARELDKDTRISRLGVGASDLVTAAEKRGLQGSALNNSSSNEMRQALERGNRVMAMIDNGGNPHWIDVLEMRPNGQGGETMVYADPATGTKREMDRAEFESKWNDPMRGKGRLVSALTGYKNMMVAFDQDGGNLPPERLGGALGFDTVADELSNLYQDSREILRGNPGRALSNFRPRFPGLPGPSLPGPSLPPPPPPPNPFRLPNPFGW